MVWFTGTSTGNQYTVGQSYSMGGDVYVAQSDGSFQNQRSGNSLVGSSESSSVQWGGFGSLTGSGSGGGAALWSHDQAWAGNQSPTPGSGSGVPGAVQRSGGARDTVAGPGGSPIQIKSGRQSALQLGPSQTTRLWFGGQELKLDRSTSDADQGEQRWGEGDLFSPSWFFQWGVAGRDIYVGNFKTEKIEADAAKLPSIAADTVIDFAQYVDARKAAVAEKDRRAAFKGDYWEDPLKVYRDLGQYPF